MIANRKLQIADAHRYQNGSLSAHRFYHRHNVNNAAFSDEIDDDETNVLIPFSNGSITCSTTDDEIASVSSEESGYLEPIKTRKQRVFLKWTLFKIPPEGCVQIFLLMALTFLLPSCNLYLSLTLLRKEMGVIYD